MTDNRNITVGKSWPRPATPCDLVPNWEGEFSNHADWVNFASKRLTVASDSNGRPLSAICVDSLGRRCHNGRDFARARDEGTFPVRYFFECQPRSLPADDERLAVLASAVQLAADTFASYGRLHRAKGTEDGNDKASRNEALAVSMLVALKGGAAPVPSDVSRLVAAARIVAFEDQSPEALRELDKASEAFASRVPWDDEPFPDQPVAVDGHSFRDATGLHPHADDPFPDQPLPDSQLANGGACS